MEKKLFLSAFIVFLAFCSFAQDKIPSIKIKDLDGNMIDASTLDNGDKPVIVSFWAIWCKPCVRELNAINDQYVDWIEETGVKLVAISIDDTRNSGKVRPFIISQGWRDYEVYLDENSELRRALNVNNIPHTFLLDKDGKIVWQHNGYKPGDEDHLYELVEKLTSGQSISE